jgi:ABC-type antimicrobial peptide transport system permease subunit
LPSDGWDESVTEACGLVEKFTNEVLGNHIKQPYNEVVSADHATWLEKSLLGHHADNDNDNGTEKNDNNKNDNNDNNSVLSKTLSIDSIQTEIRDLKYYVSGLDNDHPYLAVHSIDASVNRIRSLDLNNSLRWATHTLLCLNVSHNLLKSLNGIQACQVFIMIIIIIIIIIIIVLLLLLLLILLLILLLLLLLLLLEY